MLPRLHKLPNECYSNGLGNLDKLHSNKKKQPECISKQTVNQDKSIEIDPYYLYDWSKAIRRHTMTQITVKVSIRIHKDAISLGNYGKSLEVKLMIIPVNLSKGQQC